MRLGFVRGIWVDLLEGYERMLTYRIFMHLDIVHVLIVKNHVCDIETNYTQGEGCGLVVSGVGWRTLRSQVSNPNSGVPFVLYLLLVGGGYSWN